MKTLEIHYPFLCEMHNRPCLAATGEKEDARERLNSMKEPSDLTDAFYLHRARLSLEKAKEKRFKAIRCFGGKAQ